MSTESVLPIQALQNCLADALSPTTLEQAPTTSVNSDRPRRGTVRTETQDQPRTTLPTPITTQSAGVPAQAMPQLECEKKKNNWSEGGDCAAANGWSPLKTNNTHKAIWCYPQPRTCNCTNLRTIHTPCTSTKLLPVVDRNGTSNQCCDSTIKGSCPALAQLELARPHRSMQLLLFVVSSWHAPRGLLAAWMNP